MGDEGPKRNACGSHGSIEDGRKRMESERWYGVLEKEGGEIDQGQKGMRVMGEWKKQKQSISGHII